MVAQNNLNVSVKSIPWPRRALLRAASRGDIVVKTIWGVTAQPVESLSLTDELVGSLIDDAYTSAHTLPFQKPDESGPFYDSFVPIH